MGPPTAKQVDLFSGVRVFYREQGNTVNAPTILLLHGFPSSSHQFRNLMPLLATQYRVIAPDLPGFGFTEAPTMAHPWVSDSRFNDQTPSKPSSRRMGMHIWKASELYGSLSKTFGRVPLEAYFFDHALLQRPRIKEVQIDLIWDYQNNLPFYGKFQQYFQKSQVPLFAIWGKNDVYFIPPGAKAFKRDLPNAEIKLIDAGHFAVESHTELIAQDILTFLGEKNLWELDVGMGVM
ncbi:hydrolase-like protein [Penicillium brevicompactum]|uniref:hydrolase-like protein n=1 Tax=Penicillium brevicompactum TaxID=5074 RepID=UPI0025402072|nr:hydrolase-like protein [Penicillium brevicompactum]KAJ5343161.1 hydrolase-like protein [Penicillium brevicompactum]